jgi:hypothetical protein
MDGQKNLILWTVVLQDQKMTKWKFYVPDAAVGGRENPAGVDKGSAALVSAAHAAPQQRHLAENEGTKRSGGDWEN